MMSIPFETSDKPWFGPRKRATELLALRTQVLPPAEALRAFQEILGRTADKISRVRFIDYVHRYEQPFRYTIAIVWIGPDASARDVVYESAEQIVKATGWYPLPQGERLSSRAAEREFRKLRIPTAPGPLLVSLGGELQYIQSAVGQEGGCCVRVETSDGSLLLDTGLPGALQRKAADRLVLLSHSHLDHCGGIVSGACEGLPTVMTTATARLLIATGRVPTRWLRKHAVLLDGGQEVQVGGVMVSPFTVPHCPGSVGYVVAGQNATVVFTGDLALRSARHDFVPKLSKILFDHSPARCALLLDATMAGRTQGATRSETAMVLLSKLAEYEDIVVVSDDVEQLLYAYLDLFHTAKKRAETRAAVEFVATPALRSVFEILHSAFISRQLDLLDPFLTAQYGQSMSSWAESRWLFWLGPGCDLKVGDRYKRIWFVTRADLPMVSPRRKVGVTAIGRLESDPSVAPSGWDVLNLDSAVWTLHSDEATLCETVRQLPPCGKLLLFHNYPKRLKRFAAANGLECQALDAGGLAVSIQPT